MRKQIKNNLDTVLYALGAILLLLVVILAYKFTRTSDSSSNTLTAVDPFCSPTELEGSIQLDGAAGNVYGKVMIKNISERACDIVGSNYLDVRYDIRNVRNVELMPQGTPGESILHIEPNQTVYSQIHYPNGPQCSGATKSINVLYAYRVSTGNEVIVKKPSGEATSLNVCTSSKMTTVDIWPLSTSEITN
jgi:hypothetical protein